MKNQIITYNQFLELIHKNAPNEQIEEWFERYLHALNQFTKLPFSVLHINYNTKRSLFKIHSSKNIDALTLESSAWVLQSINTKKELFIDLNDCTIEVGTQVFINVHHCWILPIELDKQIIAVLECYGCIDEDSQNIIKSTLPILQSKLKDLKYNEKLKDIISEIEVEKEFFRKTINFVTSGVLFCSIEGSISRVNDCFLNDFSLRRENVVHTNLLDLFVFKDFKSSSKNLIENLLLYPKEEYKASFSRDSIEATFRFEFVDLPFPGYIAQCTILSQTEASKAFLFTIEKTPSEIGIINKEGKFITVNERLSGILRYPTEFPVFLQSLISTQNISLENELEKVDKHLEEVNFQNVVLHNYYQNQYVCNLRIVKGKILKEKHFIVYFEFVTSPKNFDDWEIIYAAEIKKIVDREIESYVGKINAEMKELKLANIKLNAHKRIIEEKNKDILSSIQYARRIQDALLPSKMMFESFFPQHFILYKPLSVVSGDFFWVGKTNTKVIVCCIDCTGHGVPGALMSVLGSVFLNENILHRNLDAPDKILESLNDSIQRVFNQESTNSQDGMDATICSFDLENNTVDISSAHQSYIVEENTELRIIKGSKRGLGGRMNSYTPFKVDTFLLSNLSKLYLYTDGVCDQFGGPDNKKFSTKRLLSTLTEIQHLPMLEQHRILDRILSEWKHFRKQTDDILTIGIDISNFTDYYKFIQ